jgi:hypothetical protein
MIFRRGLRPYQTNNHRQETTREGLKFLWPLAGCAKVHSGNSSKVCLHSTNRRGITFAKVFFSVCLKYDV